MKFFAVTFSALTLGMALASTGCLEAPGKPKPGSEAARPGQVLDAKVLYQHNCAACHGENGRNGAAISLANPVYLQAAGSETLRRITRDGVPGTMMPAFGKSTGGFRPGRSQHDALDALAYGIKGRYIWHVLDADIRAFFDTIDHDWLIRFVEHRIADKRIIRLIRKWLKVGVLERGALKETKESTPQGAVISPLLANIYLRNLLQGLSSRRIRENTRQTHLSQE